MFLFLRAHSDLTACYRRQHPSPCPATLVVTGLHHSLCFRLSEWLESRSLARRGWLLFGRSAPPFPSVPHPTPSRPASPPPPPPPASPPTPPNLSPPRLTRLTVPRWCIPVTYGHPSPSPSSYLPPSALLCDSSSSRRPSPTSQRSFLFNSLVVGTTVVHSSGCLNVSP